MYNRFVEFAETNKLSFFRQFGFRKDHSTSHALIHLLNKISSAIDQHETTVGIFLDLSEAFDTIDHEILFTKLEHYGIRVAALQWIKSYFSYCNLFSLMKIVLLCRPYNVVYCKVPFLALYINDLPNASELIRLLLLLTILVFLLSFQLKYLRMCS